MKLRKVLSVFAIALVPILAGAQGCVVESDNAAQSENVTSLTNYTINFDRMNAQYPGEVPMQTLTDPWTALVKIGDKTIPAPTHLFGDVVNIIPYSNDDNGVDAKGQPFPRHDMVISKYYKPGMVGIGLKMHRPEKRVLDLNNSDAADMKEDFKLQDTHIEVVVGVEKNLHGQPGAITLNNPQGYEEGLFGDPTYSMIFLEPVFPGWVGAEQYTYMDNVRSVLVGFNATTDFPGDYNGGDPLGARNPEKVAEYTAQMVRAIAGDNAARGWFQDSENQVYCAELAFLSFSAGLITPLNKTTMEPMVGAEVWAKFVEQVDLHNAGVDEFQETGELPTNPSTFVTLNENKRVAMVRITLAPESLKPMADLAPNPEITGQQLALMPLTMADIVREFMRTHIPRQIVGEELAPVQGAVLAKMKPGLLEQMGMDQMPDSDPRKIAVNALFDQMVEVVGTPHDSYQAFHQALEPLMAQARAITGPRDGDTGEGLFVPPSLFHVAAQGQYHGLIGMQYVGHGVHVKNVQKKTDDTPVDPTPVEDIPSEVSCKTPPASNGHEPGNNTSLPPDSCGGMAPGGCFCDASCQEAGDCCADAVEYCGL